MFVYGYSKRHLRKRLSIPPSSLQFPFSYLSLYYEHFFIFRDLSIREREGDLRILKKTDTTKNFIVLFSPEKLVLLSLLKEVKLSPDRRTIKLVIFDYFFPLLRHSS